MDCSLPGSSVCGISQARILQWVAISFSRGYFWPRDSTWVSCTADSFFTVRATREARQLLEAAHIPWFGYGPLFPCSKPVISHFSQTLVLLSSLCLSDHSLERVSVFKELMCLDKAHLDNPRHSHHLNVLNLNHICKVSLVRKGNIFTGLGDKRCGYFWREGLLCQPQDLTWTYILKLKLYTGLSWWFNG